jgi:hypothetical protein
MLLSKMEQDQDFNFPTHYTRLAVSVFLKKAKICTVRIDLALGLDYD